MSASDKPPSKPSDVIDPHPRVMPAPRGEDQNLDTMRLSVEDVRQRLAARERDMRYHVEALKHETVTLFDDVNVDGRPLMDRIRQRPGDALALAAGATALLGVLWGVARRAKRRPEVDERFEFIRARLDVALDEAARRVARGADTEDAIEESMEEMPVIYGDASAVARHRTSRQVATDAFVSAAAGFLAKSLADAVVQRFTDDSGLLDALSGD